MDPQPNVWVGKIAHGSYDNWCDGHGLVRDIYRLNSVKNLNFFLDNQKIFLTY